MNSKSASSYKPSKWHPREKQALRILCWEVDTWLAIHHITTDLEMKCLAKILVAVILEQMWRQA